MPEAPFFACVDGPPKPHVHPLRSPTGRVLTRVSPPDHAWHYGLWFAVKFVDGVNFWEEPGGEQRAAPGTEAGASGVALEWVRPDGRVALREQRAVSSPAPFVLDWTTTLTAPATPTGGAVVLDRTPYTTWGGYGGLAFRGAADWESTRIVLDDGSVHRRPEGVPSRWADLSGADAGVTFLDHPRNPRHPVPWYGATRSRVYGEGWSNFLNAAFLFHSPLELGAGASSTFRYRLVVHDGSWSAADAEAAWVAWVGAAAGRGATGSEGSEGSEAAR